MDNPNVILTPDGCGIILKTISFVGLLYDSDGHDNPKWDHCYFTIHYGPKPTEHSFAYYYHEYSDDKKTLFAKAQNIRNELLKMMNNGIDAKQINAKINLKKKDDK